MRQIRNILYIVLATALIASAVILGLRRCSSGSGTAPADTIHIDTIPYMVTQIKKYSRLNTAELKVHKIIIHDDIMQLSGKVLGKDLTVNIPAGDRKVAIPLHATIKASIDMSKVTEDNIIRFGDKIEVFLPQPEITITETHVDHKGVRQYVALTRSRFSDKELQSYERQGREAIERDIPNMNITGRARESAARQIIPIIKAMGFKEENITISFRDNDRTNTIIRKND